LLARACAAGLGHESIVEVGSDLRGEGLPKGVRVADLWATFLPNELHMAENDNMALDAIAVKHLEKALDKALSLAPIALVRPLAEACVKRKAKVHRSGREHGEAVNHQDVVGSPGTDRSQGHCTFSARRVFPVAQHPDGLGPGGGASG